MSEWLARARPWLNGLLVLILLLPLAQLSWRFVVPAEKRTVQATSDNASANVRPSQARLDLSPIRNAMIFGQANAVGLNGQLPESNLSIKLQGVIAAGDSPTAVAIFDSGEPKLRAVSVGMAVMPDVVLKAVFKDHAVVTNHGRDERLSLQTPPPITLNNPAPNPAPSGNPNVIEPYPTNPNTGAPPQSMGGPGPVPMGGSNNMNGAPPGGYGAYGGNSAPPNNQPRY